MEIPKHFGILPLLMCIVICQSTTEVPVPATAPNTSLEVKASFFCTVPDIYCIIGYYYDQTGRLFVERHIHVAQLHCFNVPAIKHTIVLDLDHMVGGLLSFDSYSLHSYWYHNCTEDGSIREVHLDLIKVKPNQRLKTEITVTLKDFGIVPSIFTTLKHFYYNVPLLKYFLSGSPIVKKFEDFGEEDVWLVGELKRWIFTIHEFQLRNPGVNWTRFDDTPLTYADRYITNTTITLITDFSCSLRGIYCIRGEYYKPRRYEYLIGRVDMHKVEKYCTNATKTRLALDLDLNGLFWESQTIMHFRSVWHHNCTVDGDEFKLSDDLGMHHYNTHTEKYSSYDLLRDVTSNARQDVLDTLWYIQRGHHTRQTNGTETWTDSDF